MATTEVTVHITTNFSRIAGRMRRAALEARGELESEMRLGAHAIRDEAVRAMQDVTPVVSGTLRDSTVGEIEEA